MFKYSRRPTQTHAQKITYASFWEFRFWLISYNSVITVLKGVGGGGGKFVPVHSLNTYGGSAVMAPLILKRGTRRKWMVSRFSRRERTVSVHWIGDQVTPRSGLGVLEKRDTLATVGIQFSNHSLATILNNLSRLWVNKRILLKCF